MPTYSFQCHQCGLRFQKRVSVSKSNSMACTSCGSDTNKLVPDTVGVSFVGNTNGSLLPQNTGVSSTDYNADRIIGEGSAKLWKQVSDRNAMKHQILAENPTARGEDLSRLPSLDGKSSYRILEPEERKARETALAIHKRARSLGHGGSQQ